MSATFVAATQFGDKSLTEYIAYVARVSNPSNQHNDETADKLIDYLIRNKHWSPFEMAHVTLHIATTRDIARQMLRHRSFSFQEFSQRYSEISGDALWSVRLRSPRLKDRSNRQNSIEPPEGYSNDLWVANQRRVMQSAAFAYRQAINDGIAPEVARAVLPEGLTTSRLYMTGSVRSWIHYVDVRTDPSTQKEHRLIAHEIADALKPVFPRIESVRHER